MTMDIHQHSVGLRVETSNMNGENQREDFNRNKSPGSTSPAHPHASPTSASPKSSYLTSTTVPFLSEKPKIKRSFDVAFLIQPDDLSKKRQQKLKQPQLHLNLNSSHLTVSEAPKHSVLPNDAHIPNVLLQNSCSYLYQQTHINYMNKLEEQSPPYNLVISEQTQNAYNLESLNMIGSRSAFTKVTQPLSRAEKLEEKVFSSPPTSPSISSQISGGGGMSPDNSYQDSLSPPVLIRSPEPFVRQKLPQDFHQAPITAPNLPFFTGDKTNSEFELKLAQQREKSERRANNSYADPKSPIIHVNVNVNDINANAMGNEKLSPNKSFPSPKSLRLSGGENVSYPSEGFPYPGLSVPNYPFPQMSPFPRQAVSMPLLAAATANVALLPTSLAALTLPAQNVCAKCKVSFRMTSDLVYHMRSHHKRETTVNDNLRKRREEKLKCPVCNESFRERHHLTRHMTAHQDKEGDRVDLEDEEISEITSRASKKLPADKLGLSGVQSSPGK